MPDEELAAILALARRRLMRGEAVDPEAWAAAHPAHAAELRRLLPALAALTAAVREEQAIARGRERALASFRAAFALAAPAPATLGAVVSGIASLGSDAFLQEVEQAGLPRAALEQLRSDPTPLERLHDNGVVKAIADRIGVSFRNARVALATLLSMHRFFSHQGGYALTRNWQQSSEAEIRELLRRIREEARRDSPQGKGPENAP